MDPQRRPSLALPRRPRAAWGVWEASAAARASIRAVVAAAADDDPGSLERARSLRQVEVRLAEREWAVEEGIARAAERQRDLDEREALVAARERLVAAVRRPVRSVGSAEERKALDGLRGELDRRELALKEARAAVAERERFLDDSEAKLFAKVQEQQEKEIELDQRSDDLAGRDRRLREREARIDPAAAARLLSEDSRAAHPDEFRE